MHCQPLNVPTKATPFSVAEYVVNIYQHGTFVIAYRYTQCSGDSMMEEVRELRRRAYPADQGYTIEW